MEKILTTVALGVFFLSLVSVASGHTPDEPFRTDLIAGRHIDAGDVLVWNDSDFLYIKYTTAGKWCLAETHLHVATSLSGIPQTKTGNPKPGRFEYKSMLDPCANELLYKIPLVSACEDILYIAAQAVVRSKWREETAWGYGFDFPGKNWAMYFTYQVQCPPICTGSIGDFVWEDLSQDGLQDPWEPGIAGFTIYLKSSDETIIASTTTDVNGYYQFTGLCAGSYKVEVEIPQYYALTDCSEEQSVPDDSNCSPATVTLPTDSSSNQTIDFGFLTPM